ncbi:hypothetical protein EYF80_027981 [Liparis tanakae]|uniref:Uncharacterized protein n=1 Tax=Liparis tanakae TaxID=230148 RepID=A0A4Z2H7I3_9TELE|nr:hypothetical protein EYF80_027981 [Liparis tanakae]
MLRCFITAYRLSSNLRMERRTASMGLCRAAVSETGGKTRSRVPSPVFTHEEVGLVLCNLVGLFGAVFTDGGIEELQDERPLVHQGTGDKHLQLLQAWNLNLDRRRRASRRHVTPLVKLKTAATSKSCTEALSVGHHAAQHELIILLHQKTTFQNLFALTHQL